MARLNAKNNAETVLAQAVSESDTEFIVEDAGALPDVPFRLSIEDEIVEVSAVDGNTLTVERAVEDTQAGSYDVGTAVENRLTAGMYRELISEDEFTSHKADVATENKLGHIKVGDGLTIDEQGKLNTNTNGTGVPSGVIVMWSGSIGNVPSGWSLCDGGSGTPDLRDRFIVGAGKGYSIGDTGGEDSVSLSTSELPAHYHSSGTLRTSTNGAHSHSYQQDLGTEIFAEKGNDDFYRIKTNPNNGQTSTSGSHSHSISGNTSSTGAGEAHENRPPFYALAYIMKL